MKHYFYLSILSLFILVASCSKENKQQMPTPSLDYGIAKLTGTITNYKSTDSLTFSIPYVNSLLGERVVYEASVDTSGVFYIEIPMATNYAIVTLLSTGKDLYQPNLLLLTANKTTCIELASENRFRHKYLSIKADKPHTVLDNLEDFQNVYMDMMQTSGKWGNDNQDSLDILRQNPDYFIEYNLMYDLGIRLNCIDNDTILSPEMKEYLRYEMKSVYVINLIHPSTIDEYIGILKKSKNVENSDNLETPRSYYFFLKDFDLNNPQYLYTSQYSFIAQDLLATKCLNINSIKEMPIAKWLIDAKEKLSDLLGFDKGLFYDILVINAYNKQFADKIEPLSEIQKQNIHDYYKGSAVEKIILARSEEIAKMDNFFGEVVINETPNLTKEKLMESILSKYKGKTVLVDFWGTWCGPCISSMAKFRSTKNALNRKYTDDLVFVYVAAQNSSIQEWEKHIENLDGEHYYVSNEQWDYLLESLDFSSVPTYLFYNSEGNLVTKKIGITKPSEMKETIEDILNK